MNNERPHEDAAREVERVRSRIPRASSQFRRRSWLLFQRALDPLAPPRPFRARKR